MYYLFSEFNNTSYNLYVYQKPRKIKHLQNSIWFSKKFFQTPFFLLMCI